MKVIENNNMKKRRVPVGEPHWYIDLFNGIDIWHRDERRGSVVDDNQWDCGNYFNTREEAEAMARKLRAVFKGADVVETPSEEEIKERLNMIIPTQPVEPWCVEGYCKHIIEFIKSKIVK